jgi:hypothetical protein
LPVGGETEGGLTGLRLPFEHHLQCDADLLMLRRSDGSFVAAFNASNVDPFEVEWAVW